MTISYLRIDEAAVRIGVSRRTVTRLISRGLLPARRLRGGRTVLIDERDLDACLEPAGTAGAA